MPNKPTVTLLVKMGDVDPYSDANVVFALAESSETKSGTAIEVTVVGRSGNGGSVNLDPSAFLDVSDLLLEAVNAASDE